MTTKSSDQIDLAPPESRLQVLLLDYEMARDDDRSAIATQATILTVAVAILAAFAVSVTQVCTYGMAPDRCTEAPDSLLAFLPMVPLAMMAYTQMLGTTGTIRSYYTRAIEYELRQYAPGPLTVWPKLAPASYTELLTSHISATRGGRAYRFVSFSILVALVTVFGGLTVFIASGLSRGWIIGMAVVYGTIGSAVAIEAFYATVGGRSLFRRLVDRLPRTPSMMRVPLDGRSLLSSLLVPRARFDEAMKRAFMPIAFALALAAPGSNSVGFWTFLLVWLVFEFLFYDARYQWNDIRNYEEDRKLARRERLPYSSEDRESAAWLRSSQRILTAALVAVVVRVVVGLALVTWLTADGDWGRGLIWGLALVTLVLIPGLVYEYLREREAVWPVWLWVGVGYGARAVVGVVLAGFEPTSPVTLLTFLMVGSLGTMSVTMTWTLQTMGRCSGTPTAAVLHAETRPHLTRLLALAGVRIFHRDNETPPADELAGRQWRIVRTRPRESVAPWEVASIAGAMIGGALGALLADGQATVQLVGMSAACGLGACLLLTSPSALRLAAAAIVTIGPAVLMSTAVSWPDHVIAAAPNTLLVALYLFAVKATCESLEFEIDRELPSRVGRRIRDWVVGPSTAEYFAKVTATQRGPAHPAAGPNTDDVALTSVRSTDNEERDQIPR